MAAKNFTDPQGWGATHTVVMASTKPYGNPPRTRVPGDIIEETPFFIFEAIDGDNLHVKAHRIGHPGEFAIADTPNTTPPEIHFTLAEKFQGKDPISTRYDAMMVVFTGSPRTVCGSYSRTIGAVALLVSADETGTWTGNNPPPGSGGPKSEHEERSNQSERKEPADVEGGWPKGRPTQLTGSFLCD